MDIAAQEGLQARHQALQDSEPGLRIRERARRLGVSEAELVAGQLGVTARRLRCEPTALFPRLPLLGRIMCLTRNEWCVHERYGQFVDVQCSNPKVGLVLGPDIDLRLFFDHWQTAWEVLDNGRRSLQFFDRHGLAVHKIFRTEDTDAAAWEALVDEFALPADGAQAPGFEPLPAAVSDHGELLSAERRQELRTAWLAMTDPHQFFPMLGRLKLSRISAIRNAGSDLAQQTAPDAVETVLQAAAASGLPIMVFVGSPGTVQIHGGPVHKLMRTGPWYNVLDPDFNLHLNTAAIASSWVVHKPTDDGPVTSLELFADDGSLIAQFFGLRKPGIPERADWRALLVAQCKEPLHA